MKEEQLLTYLKANCAGRGKAQTRSQLQRTLNLSKDQLTNLVHRMRCKGVPIAGGPGGYFYAQNAGEIHATIRWLEKMVRTLLKSINGLSKAMESFGPIGAPAEAQPLGGEAVPGLSGPEARPRRSGFGGERRSDGAGELPANRRERASAVRDDDGGESP